MNMLITALLPFLIIIIIIYLVTSTFQKKSGSKSSTNTFVSERIVKWIFAGYVGVLILATVIYVALPKDYFAYEIDGEYNRSSEIVEIEDSYIDFYNVIQNNELDELEDVMKREQWEFKYSEEELLVMSDEYYGISTYVEHKDENDGKVEVTYYSTEFIIEGIDFTNEIEGPQMELLGNKLQINVPDRLEIKFAKFDQEFTVKQFKGELWNQTGHHFSYPRGQEGLYIKVPKDLQLEEWNLNLDYVDEIRQ